MAEVYDRLMFHDATYADLIRSGLPMISINATDVANGVSFPFLQGAFDLICADLSTYPVARAVAASTGFPILFTPITLTSHRKDCGATTHTCDSTDLARRGSRLSIAEHYWGRRQASIRRSPPPACALQVHPERESAPNTSARVAYRQIRNIACESRRALVLRHVK